MPIIMSSDARAVLCAEREGEAVAGAEYADSVLAARAADHTLATIGSEGGKRKRGIPSGTDVLLQMADKTWRSFRKPVIMRGTERRQKQLTEIIKLFIHLGMDISISNISLLGFGCGPTQRTMLRAIGEAMRNDGDATEAEKAWASGPEPEPGVGADTDILLRTKENTWMPFRKPVIVRGREKRQEQLTEIVKLFIQNGVEVSFSNFARLGFGRGPTQQTMLLAIAKAMRCDEAATDEERAWAAGTDVGKPKGVDILLTMADGTMKPFRRPSLVRGEEKKQDLLAEIVKLFIQRGVEVSLSNVARLGCGCGRSTQRTMLRAIADAMQCDDVAKDAEKSWDGLRAGGQTSTKRKRTTTNILLKMPDNTWKPFIRPVVVRGTEKRQEQLTETVKLFIQNGIVVSMSNVARLGFGRGPAQRTMLMATAESLRNDDASTEEEKAWAAGPAGTEEEDEVDDAEDADDANDPGRAEIHT